MSREEIKKAKARMNDLYGENHEISGKYDETLAIKCHNGIFLGKRNGSVLSWKGIPFAKPPIGALRWKAPVPYPKSNTVRTAYFFGPSCIQTKTFTEQASLYHQSEDCLYLNVWINETDSSKKKPVMVFIHGGSYGWGGTSDPLYEGTNFVAEYPDIVLVTIAYRIGIYGFMDFSSVPGGDQYPDSCNAGLLDQIEALKWVKKNISAFGGNPENITVFGESAGGGSVSILPVMPLAKGLFKKVIAESGSVALTFSIEECQGLTEKLLKESGRSKMSELIDIPEDELAEINLALNELNNFPMRDGRIVPEDLFEAYKRGDAAEIAMITGTNADESRYWIGELGGIQAYILQAPVLYENMYEMLTKTDKKRLDKFMSLKTDKKIWNESEFYTEILFRIPSTKQAELHTLSGGKTWVYYWTYPSAIENYKACHAVELAYVFNNLEEQIYTGNNINPDLAKRVQQMWVNFARTGNPSITNYIWPEYDAIDRNVMYIGELQGIVKDPMSAERKLLEPILKYGFNGTYTELNYNVPHIRKAAGQALVLLAAVVGAVAGSIILIKKLRKGNK